jgi:Flp pilus assembly protein CpaB
MTPNPVHPEPAGRALNKSALGVLLLSVLLGLAATYMIKMYVHRVIFMVSGGEFEQLLFAKTDIPAGTSITPAMLESRNVPAAYVHLKAVRASQQSFVISQRPTENITKGEAILWNEFELASKPDLSEKLGIDERAVTITIDQRSDQAGLLQPGDRVDVLATLTLPGKDLANRQAVTTTILQNVTILAVDGDMTPRQSDDATIAEAAQKGITDKAKAQLQSASTVRKGNTVTLKLHRHDASLLVFVENRGEIQLVLRSRDDIFVQPADDIDFSALQLAGQNAAPPAASGAEAAAAPAHTSLPRQESPEGYPMIYEEGLPAGNAYWPELERQEIQPLLDALKQRQRFALPEPKDDSPEPAVQPAPTAIEPIADPENEQLAP